MRQLLWKDWRVYRTIVFGSVLLMLFIYGLAMAALVVMQHQYAMTTRHITDQLEGASLIALWITFVLSAVFGGAAFSLERGERSADFLAMLPASRIRIARSKAIVSIASVILLLVLNVWVTFACRHFAWMNNSARADARVICIITTASMMAYGISWLLSTFMNSAALAFGISIVLTLGTISMIGLYGERTGTDMDATTWQMMIATTITGVIAFVVGVIYYLRRSSP